MKTDFLYGRHSNDYPVISNCLSDTIFRACETACQENFKICKKQGPSREDRGPSRRGLLTRASGLGPRGSGLAFYLACIITVFAGTPPIVSTTGCKPDATPAGIITFT